MHLSDLKTDENDPLAIERTIAIGRAEEIPSGSCKRFELPEGNEIVVYNVDGDFHATSNFCPHKGAPLSEGILCGNIIECGLHGWQFDVRTGECLTVVERIERYSVRVEGGVLWVVCDRG